MDYQLVFKFLTDLSNNNNREWFDDNRSTYQEVKKQFEGEVEKYIDVIASIDPDVAACEVKKSIFRLFRDVRFSKNKEPYKTNLGAAIAKQGRKSGHAGYYIHIKPNGETMIGGGMYCPESSILQKIRQEIDYCGDEFKGIVEGKNFKGSFGELWDGDRLKLAPKGYPKDHTNIDLLKNKSFVAMRHFSDEDILNKDVPQLVLEQAKLIHPFNQFLNRAMID